jgi:hypothetical protein
MELIAEALEKGRHEYRRLRRGEESLAEDLFLYVITSFSALEPHRRYLSSVVETALSPFVLSGGNTAGERVRVEHLEEISSLLASHNVTDQPSFVAVNLYWALYLGVLAFWSQDASPKQEDTLVLLDQSIRLFVASVASSQSRSEVDDGDQR